MRGAAVSETAGAQRSVVQSVERAGEVINTLSRAGRPLSALELARETGLNRTIVHRLLRTLAGMGFVEERGDARYGPGPMLVPVAQSYVDRLAVRRAAVPYLLDLSRAFVDQPWVVALAIPVPSGVVLVERIWQPNAPLDALLSLGTQLGYTVSAHGRATLSMLPESEARSLVGDAEYEGVEQQLTVIRQRHHVEFASSELMPGLSAIAVAIPGNDGMPVGSVAVSGTDLSSEQQPDSPTVARLLRTSASIARASGM